MGFLCKKEEKIRQILTLFLLDMIFYPIIVLFLPLAFLSLLPIIGYVAGHIEMYQWLFYGMGGYFIVSRLPFIRKNIEWMQTFSHELTHTIVGLLFFHKIYSFKAEQGTGMITHAGRRFGGIFIDLSPYCLPIFTYILLLFRLMGDPSMMYLFDIFTGITLAFHISCFWKQTGLYQTDIQGQGYVRAFMFIIAGWIFNTSIVLLSVPNGIGKAFSTLFIQYWDRLQEWWHWLLQFIRYIIQLF